MEHPLQRASTGVRQVDLTGTLERYAGGDSCNRGLDRIELEFGVGPRTERDLAVHRRLSFWQLEFGLPLPQQVPSMVHWTNVRHQHCRMLSGHVLAPSLEELRQGYDHSLACDSHTTRP